MLVLTVWKYLASGLGELFAYEDRTWAEENIGQWIAYLPNPNEVFTGKYTLNVLQPQCVLQEQYPSTADGTEISSQPTWRAVCVPGLQVGPRHIAVSEYLPKQVWSE